jgi:hypothetical protein
MPLSNFRLDLSQQTVIATSTAAASASIPAFPVGSYQGQSPFWLMTVSGVPAYVTSAPPNLVSGSYSVGTGSLSTSTTTLFPVGQVGFVSIPSNTLVIAQTAAGSGQVTFTRAFPF